MVERSDGLQCAIETIQNLRPHVPYSVTLLQPDRRVRLANVASFAEAMRLAQTSAGEMERARGSTTDAYEQFKAAALALLGAGKEPDK